MSKEFFICHENGLPKYYRGQPHTIVRDSDLLSGLVLVNEALIRVIRRGALSIYHTKLL